MYDPAEYPPEPDKFESFQFFVLNLKQGEIVASFDEIQQCRNWITDHGQLTITYTVVRNIGSVQIKETRERHLEGKLS